MRWCEKDTAEKVADLDVLRRLVSQPEIRVEQRVVGFNRILAMAGVDSVDPTKLDGFSDDEWGNMFGDHAFGVAVALQAFWIEAVCDPRKIVPASVLELQPLLETHRRVRRLAPD